MMIIKDLDTIKKEYNDYTDIKCAEDMRSLAINFIRIVYWKKIREHEYIYNRDAILILPIVKDIVVNGFDKAKLKVKKDDLNKAQNAKYLYKYYGYNFDIDKNTKINKFTLLEEISKAIMGD